MTAYTIMVTIFLIFVVIVIIYEKVKNKKINKERLNVIDEVIKGNFNARIMSRTKGKDREVDFAVNTLIEKLQKVKIQAQTNEKKRKQLLSNISHDIRTPLTAIIGYIDAVNGELNLTLQEKEKYLNIISKKSKELKRLIDEIFELAKLDANELPLKPEILDLNEIVRSTVIQFIPQFKQHGIEVKAKIPDIKYLVEIDKNSIIRIVQNLIQNAIQHGKEGKIIGIEVAAKQGRYIITVWDKGKGIQADKIDYIFDRLFKADDSRKKGANNYGLGLAIAKKLTEKNDGTIEVESNPGKKTKFIVKFYKKI